MFVSQFMDEERIILIYLFIYYIYQTAKEERDYRGCKMQETSMMGAMVHCPLIYCEPHKTEHKLVQTHGKNK